MTRKQSKEIRIDTLILAAVEEFLEKGYNGASVDAIAKRAGVSKGGFYHHFPGKEVLLMEANRKLSEPVMEMIEDACSNESAIDGLRTYIHSYLKYWIAHPKELSFFFLSMSKALESEVLSKYYKDYIEQYIGFLEGMFQKSVEMGELDITDTKAYGISLMGALDGTITYFIVKPEDDVEVLAERFTTIWLKGRKGDGRCGKASKE